MLGINLKHSIATLAVAAGVLTAAGPASAGAVQPSSLIGHNGHAGLGANAYQHNQSDLEFLASSVTDGTSNTVMFARM